MINEIANKVKELASKVIPSQHLKSFLELSLKDQLVGIMTFAGMAKDTEMINFAQKAINYIEAQ